MPSPAPGDDRDPILQAGHSSRRHPSSRPRTRATTASARERCPSRRDARASSRAASVSGLTPTSAPYQSRWTAADEQPRSVAALVGVVVEDRLVDPALAVLDLALAVHRAGRVVGVDEVDDVRTDEEERAPDVAQRSVELGPQRRATVFAADLHVVDEQRDEIVEVRASRARARTARRAGGSPRTRGAVRLHQRRPRRPPEPANVVGSADATRWRAGLRRENCA